MLNHKTHGWSGQAGDIVVIETVNSSEIHYSVLRDGKEIDRNAGKSVSIVNAVARIKSGNGELIDPARQPEPKPFQADKKDEMAFFFGYTGPGGDMQRLGDGRIGPLPPPPRVIGRTWDPISDD